MATEFEQVCGFNTTFDFPVFKYEDNPLTTQQQVCKYRCNLIHEEGIEEFGNALQVDDKVEMLDAICDHLYVLLGACHTLDINPDYYFKCMYQNETNNEDNYKTLDYILDSTPIAICAFGYNKDIITKLLNENIILEQELREQMLNKKNIFNVYPILMKLIENTYRMGFNLVNDEKLKAAFNNVHNSNMSKLCTSVEEAEKTVQKYNNDYVAGNSPYDTPYYYELKPGLYVVKNKSTGKALKSINYTPANMKQFID